MAAMKTVTVQIISDVVCPWCYIGKRRLERAMQKYTGKVDFKVEWKPYQLNPSFPETGQDKLQYYMTKFGEAKVAQMIPYMKDTFAAEGINFREGGLTSNTFNAHRLIAWAGAHSPEAQNAVVEYLFQAYFTQEQNINDPAVLAAAAKQSGLPDWQDHLNNSASAADEVKRELGQAAQLGVTGVPFFIIDGRYKVSGAQSPSAFEEIFNKVLS